MSKPRITSYGIFSEGPTTFLIRAEASTVLSPLHIDHLTRSVDYISAQALHLQKLLYRVH